MPIKLIVFDMDGVLVQSERFFFNLTSNLCQESPDKYKYELAKGTDVRSLLAAAIMRLRGMKAGILAKLARNVKLTPGTRPTLKQLKKDGYIIAVISDGIDVVANKVKNLGVDFVFTNEIGKKNGSLTGEVKLAKSKATILERLCKRLKISPNQCAVIGDDLNDLPLFSKAGLRIAYNPRSVRVAMAADHVVYNKDLRSLLPIFEQHEQHYWR